MVVDGMKFQLPCYLATPPTVRFCISESSIEWDIFASNAMFKPDLVVVSKIFSLFPIDTLNLEVDFVIDVLSDAMKHGKKFGC